MEQWSGGLLFDLPMAVIANGSALPTVYPDGEMLWNRLLRSNRSRGLDRVRQRWTRRAFDYARVPFLTQRRAGRRFSTEIKVQTPARP